MTGSWRSPHEGPWAVNDPEARYDPFVALVVVDVQNDFADSRGSLSVRGGADIVPLVNKEIELALGGGAAASTPGTGIRRTLPISRRTAASGRSTAFRTPGARSCTRTSP